MTPDSTGSASPGLKPTFPSPPVVLPGKKQYEFGEADNATLSNLGSKMSFVGLFMMGMCLFVLASVLVRWIQSHELEVGLFLMSLLFLVFGMWTLRAGREFRSVAQTEGKDITHLMGAMENLLKVYRVLYVLFLIALVFAIIQLGAHSLSGTNLGERFFSKAPQTQGSSVSPVPNSRS